jgi:hypothetical protein
VEVEPVLSLLGEPDHQCQHRAQQDENQERLVAEIHRRFIVDVVEDEGADGRASRRDAQGFDQGADAIDRVPVDAKLRHAVAQDTAYRSWRKIFRHGLYYRQRRDVCQCFFLVGAAARRRNDAVVLVVYVSPFLRKDVYLFLDRLSRIKGVRVGLISTLESERLAPEVVASIDGYWQVHDLLDVGQLVWAARGLSQRFDLPIDRMFTEYEMIQLSVAQARAELGVAGMSPETVLNFRDKAVMKDRLRAAGLPCARHQSVDSVDQAWGFASRVGFPLIVKPVDGVGARSTFQCDSADDFAQVMESDPPNAHHPLQLEEFVQGDEYTWDTVCVDGQVKWDSITRYLPTPLEVLRNPWMQWRIISPREIDGPEFDDIRQVGQQALRALGMGSNIGHMEWFRRPDGSLAISEVGARPAGSRIFTALNWANDYDMYDAWIRLMVLNSFTPPGERKYTVGTAFLRGVGVGEVVAVHGLQDMLERWGHLVVEAQLPYVGQLRADAYDGEGYLMLRHPETRVVEEAILEIISRVQVVIG